MARQEGTSTSIDILESALSGKTPIEELLDIASGFIEKGEWDNLDDIDAMLIDRFVEYMRAGTRDQLMAFQHAVLSFADSQKGDRLKESEKGQRYFHRWYHFHDLCGMAIDNYDPQLTSRFVESRKHGPELLGVLARHEEGVRHNELAKKLNMSPPHLSKLLREFLAHDLVTRERENKISIIKLGIAGRAYVKEKKPPAHGEIMTEHGVPDMMNVDIRPSALFFGPLDE